MDHKIKRRETKRREKHCFNRSFILIKKNNVLRMYNETCPTKYEWKEIDK